MKRAAVEGSVAHTERGERRRENRSGVVEGVVLYAGECGWYKPAGLRGWGAGLHAPYTSSGGLEHEPDTTR